MRANRAEICDGAEWGDLKVEFETFPAGTGDAFYMAPGHVPVFLEVTEASS